MADDFSALQWVAVGCSGLQCIAMFADDILSALQWVAVGYSGLYWVAVSCNMLLKMTSVRCSVFQCVVVW